MHGGRRRRSWKTISRGRRVPGDPWFDLGFLAAAGKGQKQEVQQQPGAAQHRATPAQRQNTRGVRRVWGDRRQGRFMKMQRSRGWYVMLDPSKTCAPGSTWPAWGMWRRHVPACRVDIGDRGLEGCFHEEEPEVDPEGGDGQEHDRGDQARQLVVGAEAVDDDAEAHLGDG